MAAPRSPFGAPIPPGVSFPGFRDPVSNFEAVRDRLQTRPLVVEIDLTTARSFAANTALKLPISGNSFFVDQKPNSGYCTCYVEDENSQGNTPITLYPGAVLRVPFTFLMFENLAQPGQSIRIVYGVDIDFVPAISAGLFGTVNVVDGEKARTLADQARTGVCFCPAVAAQFAHVQLLNPAGSGKRIVLEGIRLWSITAVAGGCAIYSRSTALTTLFDIWESKLIGGVTGVGELRSQNDAVGLGSGAAYDGALWPANEMPVPITPKKPWVLNPGQGIIAQGTPVNAALTATFDGYEEDV